MKLVQSNVSSKQLLRILSFVVVIKDIIYIVTFQICFEIQHPIGRDIKLYILLHQKMFYLFWQTLL